MHLNKGDTALFALCSSRLLLIEADVLEWGDFQKTWCFPVYISHQSAFKNSNLHERFIPFARHVE